MDFKEILELIEAIDKSALTKFSFEEGDTKIKIEKNREETICTKPVTQNEVLQIKEEVERIESDNFEYIKSPLIGTFYNSPSPEEEPYIAVGDKVSKNQVIGIIEIMKVMNEVKCNYDGIVEDILINNNDTVEYGQSLIKIKVL
ncbi:MAG: acetyl-CoA carboxylase biotin carboxyl carrier protein [Terrisporobacter othiniensis]|uniref:acetyl-CoA carboxylase biotin carboxyl carrier protein n=1 Tax=Terrisporobacter petrolearius TaxID=1460447 RepID=UPI0022E8CFB5|nr:acetyl-CoA carboxylase biotin carboxyl carrier protein [Terrisporobacter petrolearius]MDU4859444.1 acetyl-CoA carboxylase biotin carboxyl carrier protein [Terrisporobacter othiniensis]MDU6993831.1 acetyl-CoA carboxylase biotin carboxyl carrier protein [Terrisporobacter othiniensis]